MEKTFVELKLFQVKADKIDQFETMIKQIAENQTECDGCLSIKYFKRFYTVDGIELGAPPAGVNQDCKVCKVLLILGV